MPIHLLRSDEHPTTGATAVANNMYIAKFAARGKEDEDVGAEVAVARRREEVHRKRKGDDQHDEHREDHLGRDGGFAGGALAAHARPLRHVPPRLALGALAPWLVGVHVDVFGEYHRALQIVGVLNVLSGVLIYLVRPPTRRDARVRQRDRAGRGRRLRLPFCI